MVVAADAGANLYRSLDTRINADSCDVCGDLWERALDCLPERPVTAACAHPDELGHIAQQVR